MERFLDLYSFVAVMLHAAGLIARSVLAGSAVYLALIVTPLARQARSADAAMALLAPSRGWVLVAAAGGLAVSLRGATLQAGALAATLAAPLGVALGAEFLRVTLGVALSTLAAAALAAPRAPPGPWRRTALCAAGLALLACATAGTHAAARTDD